MWSRGGISVNVAKNDRYRLICEFRLLLCLVVLSFRVDISDTLMYVYEMLGAELLSNLYDRLGRQLMDPQQSAVWQVMALITDWASSYTAFSIKCWLSSTVNNNQGRSMNPFPLRFHTTLFFPLSSGHRGLVIWLPVHSWDHRCELLWRYPRSYRSDPQNQHQQRYAGWHRHVHHRYTFTDHPFSLVYEMLSEIWICIFSNHQQSSIDVHLYLLYLNRLFSLPMTRTSFWIFRIPGWVAGRPPCDVGCHITHGASGPGEARAVRVQRLHAEEDLQGV